MDKIKKLPLRDFTRYCMSIAAVPTSYLAGLSLEEQMLWLCSFLTDEVIPAVNNNGGAVEELQALYVELKNYVDNYFDNLDIQEEVNTKLEEMAQSGELAELISQYLESQAVIGFNTCSSLSEATNLANGSFARTLGRNTYNDGSGAFYKIRTLTNVDVPDGYNLILLTNTENLVAERIREINEEYYIDPREYGAKLDGTTNDTEALEAALTAGNVKLPYNSTILINDLDMPQYRILDFNYSTVKCEGTAINCGSLETTGYYRDGIIMNGYFQNDGSQGAQFPTIHLIEAIRTQIINCTQSVIPENNVAILGDNCFNTTIENVYLGNGNQSKTTGSAGIIFRCIEGTVIGTNNLTNLKVENALIQKVDYGITLDENSQGSIDSVILDNVGISTCSTGYLIKGTSTQIKNVEISHSHTEFCGIGIDNRGALTLNNIDINTPEQIGVYNRSTGILNCIGYFGLIGSGFLGFRNDNIADLSACYPSMNAATVTVSFVKPIVRPLMVVNDDHSTTDFTSFVHPIYDYQFNQTVNFSKDNLPTSNVQKGTKWTITYNDQTYTCIFNGSVWNLTPYIDNEKVLFTDDTGVSTDFSLSAYISSYKRIKIYGKTDDNRNVFTEIEPNANGFYITAVGYYNGSTYIRFAECNISGLNVTFSSNRRTQLNSGVYTVTDGSYIKITKVIGIVK